MKVSLKLREERRPIVRAKLPLNVLGLPVFTGVTSGDQEELALHLGTDVRAGPSFRVSYKPNNAFSPFSVLVKTGLGLWGSPNGALMAISAEIDLNSNGSPSFAVRVNPKFGDFGMRKDSGRFQASYQNFPRISGSGDKMITMDSGEQSRSGEADLALNDQESDALAVSPNGKAISNADGSGKDLVGTDAGAFMLEKAESFTNGTLEKSDSFEKSRDTPEKVKRINDPSPSENEGGSYEEEAESHRNALAVSRHADDEFTSAAGGVKSRFRGAAKGWRFNAHSALPFGSWAVAKVRWQAKFESNIIHDVKHGMHITDIKLPALSVDKFSFETLSRKEKSSADFVDPLGLGYGCEDGSQLGRIAAMCTSMRYQIQLLHLENKLLKSTIDDWRGELPALRRPGAKGSELLMQEDTALRSQMFDELNGKLNASTGKLREGRYSGDSQSAPRLGSGKGTTSSGEDKDPSDELQKAIMNATGGGH